MKVSTNDIIDRVTALAVELSGYDASEIPADTPFLSLGFDSLILTQFATSLQREFGVKVTFRQLIEDTSSVSLLAKRLESELPDQEADNPADEVIRPINGRVDCAQSENRHANRSNEPQASLSVPQGMSTAQFVSDEEQLQSVFMRQLELMEAQLEVLRRNSTQKETGSRKSTAIPSTSISGNATPTEKPTQRSGSEVSPKAPKRSPAVERTPTEAQRRHINRLVERYVAKTSGSRELVQSRRGVFADPRTAAGFNPLWKEMVYPIVVERSEGAYLWDIDGNRYVDLLNGFGPNFFGHKAPFVTEAIKKQLEQGFEVGPQSPIACEAAALFCELTGMERVSWVNTGSEAVQASMRIARTVTGRDKVVSFAGSYHGNFDEVLVGRRPTAPGKDTQPTAPGVPLASTSNMIVLEYGAEAALEEIRRRSDDIAMVMVEPIQSRRPEFRPVEFLKELRALTEEKGIVLLFDEVISGFRSRMGGAQEYFGVQADLATYGKVLAGGMPIGAVAGAKRFMDTFDGGAWQYDDDSIPEAGVTFFAGTFVRHPFAVAAAHACLSYMKAAGPALQQSVNRKAETLTSEMTALFSQYGAAFEMPHFASQMFLRTDGEGPMGDLFCYHLRERGVHLLEKYPTYMTAAHSEKDIDFVLEAAKSSLAELSADGFFSKSPSKQTEPAKRRFPLTEGQKEIFVASAFGPEESCAYNESITLEIEGEFDLQKFRVAFDEAVDHADAFRLRFDEFGDYQFYTDERAIELQLLDYTGKKEEPLGDPVASLCAEQAATPFDLQTGPLARAFILRVAEKKHVFVFYAHHIIFDGYSTDLLLRAIASRYNDAEIKELSSFTRFVNDVTRPAFVEKSRGEWAGAVAGLSNKSRRVLQLRGSSTSAPGAQSGQSGSTLLAEFDGEHDEAVMALAREAGVSPSAVYISIYGAMLSKAAEWEQVVVGIPSAGQALRGIETIGFCVSMWPIVIKVEEGWTVHQLLKNVQAQLNAASERPVITMGELSRALGLGVDGNNRPIITAVLNISRYFNDLRFGDARAVPIENIRSSAHYDIFLGVRRGENTVDIDCDFRTDVLSKQDVERFIEAYFSMIKHFEASSQDKVIDVLKAYDVERLAGKGRPEEDNQIPTANVDESLGSRRQPGEQPLSGDLAEVRSATNGSAADPNEKTTWTETVVLEVAEQLLGSRPHLNENFFDIGGQSLMAVRFVVEIRGRLGKTIPLSMLFDCNDFRQFAHEVDTLTIDQHQSSTRYTKANEFEIVEL